MVPGVLAFHGEKCQMLTPSGKHEVLSFTLISVLPLCTKAAMLRNYLSTDVMQKHRVKNHGSLRANRNWIQLEVGWDLAAVSLILFPQSFRICVLVCTEVINPIRAALSTSLPLQTSAFSLVKSR